MTLAGLQLNDTILVNVRGTTFAALYKGCDDNGLVKIDPLDPKHFTWRKCTARQVVERVEVQERLAVVA